MIKFWCCRWWCWDAGTAGLSDQWEWPAQPNPWTSDLNPTARFRIESGRVQFDKMQKPKPRIGHPNLAQLGESGPIIPLLLINSKKNNIMSFELHPSSQKCHIIVRMQFKLKKYNLINNTKISNQNKLYFYPWSTSYALASKKCRIVWYNLNDGAHLQFENK